MSKLNLTILLQAQPDPDYSPTSHRGSVVILPREFLVGSLARAAETLAVFSMDNALGAVNLVGAGLVRLDGIPLCRVSHDGKLLAVDDSGRATGLQYRDPLTPPPKFRDLGQLVRYLREDASLLRKDLAAGAGVAVETVRNLETERHAATPWTWRRLLQHPALQDLPRLAKEAGLELPRGVAVPGPTDGPGGGGPGGGPAAGTDPDR